MRYYTAVRKRKKGRLYIASIAALYPIVGSKESTAMFYLYPLHTVRRKRGPGKCRTIQKEYRTAQVLHHWPADVAEDIHRALFHSFKGVHIHLLKTKTSEEIAEWYQAKRLSRKKI